MSKPNTDQNLRSAEQTGTLMRAISNLFSKSLPAALVCGLVIPIALPKIVLGSPTVLVDIAPTHSLVSMVMGDIAKPQLLISSASNPHDFALRPSDAGKLNKAELIFYTSATLTPWLNKALQSLAQNTPTLELISAKNTRLLPLRDDHLFSHEHAEHAEHGDSMYDPHAWLDPENAIIWLNYIATELAKADNDNGATYLQNADRAIKAINVITQDVMQQLAGLNAVPYLVFHDSYQYFETRFNLQPQGSISLGDGSQPGISQLKELQSVIKSSQAQCVFSEPQYSDRLVKTVIGDMNVNTEILDPLGFGIENGEELYLKLIDKLSSSLFRCLSVK